MNAFKWVLGAGLMWSVASTSYASLGDFKGTWVNTNSRMRGITKMVIKAPGVDNIKVRVWGSCSPSDCDWGHEDATAYGPNVSANVARTANAMKVIYDKGFATTILIIKPMARSSRLIVDSL